MWKKNNHIVKKNRLYLEKVIETKKWLSQQSLALRGHHENNLSKNSGNFIELLELRSRDLPIVQDDSIKYSYTSPDIQNEIIDLLSSCLRKTISEECQNRPFSIIMDETSNMFTHEQIAKVIRYADDNLKIRELFIEFKKTGSTTGEDLSKILLSSVKNLGSFI